jgi:hypothetical protein
VAPVPIQTGWLAAEASIGAGTRLGLCGVPDDIADVILSLASNQAHCLTEGSYIPMVPGGRISNTHTKPARESLGRPNKRTFLDSRNETLSASALESQSGHPARLVRLRVALAECKAGPVAGGTRRNPEERGEGE